MPKILWGIWHALVNAQEILMSWIMASELSSITSGSHGKQENMTTSMCQHLVTVGKETQMESSKMVVSCPISPANPNIVQSYPIAAIPTALAQDFPCKPYGNEIRDPF